jgi:hypothetical protein
VLNSDALCIPVRNSSIIETNSRFGFYPPVSIRFRIFRMGGIGHWPIKNRRVIMKRRIKLFFTICCIVGLVSAPVAAQEWAIHADYTESCSCNPTCPCVFGSPSTHGFCEGNNLIEIKEGHYNGVNLDGISMVTAFSLGKWMKIYMNENTTEEQAQALMDLLRLDQTFGLIYAGNTKVLSQETTPISIERAAGKVKFSVPDSIVEIEMMKGKGGEPIRIQNLTLPFMDNHTQYKSIVVSHMSADKAFKHSGTNGLTSTITASSKN